MTFRCPEKANTMLIQLKAVFLLNTAKCFNNLSFTSCNVSVSRKWIKVVQIQQCRHKQLKNLSTFKSPSAFDCVSPSVSNDCYFCGFPLLAQTSIAGTVAGYGF